MEGYIVIYHYLYIYIYSEPLVQRQLHLYLKRLGHWFARRICKEANGKRKTTFPSERSAPMLSVIRTTCSWLEWVWIYIYIVYIYMYAGLARRLTSLDLEISWVFLSQRCFFLGFPWFAHVCPMFWWPPHSWTWKSQLSSVLSDAWQMADVGKDRKGGADVTDSTKTRWNNKSHSCT